MPIKMRKEKIKVNSTKSVEFDNTVYDYIVGIQSWRFCYPGGDHHVKHISLSVSADNSYNILQVSAYGELRDSSGNRIDEGESFVEVACIAVTENVDRNVQLANETRVQGQRTLPIPGNATLLQGVATGFSLEYPGDDHHVEMIKFHASASRHGEGAVLNGGADMTDDSGNSSNGGQVDGGLVAASVNAQGLLSLPSGQQQGGDVAIDFSNVLDGKTIQDTAAMIQSFKVSYGSGDHHVLEIGGGATHGIVLNPDGNTVILKNPCAHMNDDSGHNQENGKSHVNMAVFVTAS